MPDWLQALLLGALQGLTEFLPVSSSGHLVLLRSWFGEDFFAAGDEVLFFLVLHVGTLLPVLWFYRKDLGGILSSARAAPSLREAGGFVQWMRQEPSRWLAVGVVAGWRVLLCGGGLARCWTRRLGELQLNRWGLGGFLKKKLYQNPLN